jgi:hypothetical protein
VISLLVATAFCYLVFLLENDIQRKAIQEQEQKLLTVGTELQKDQEKVVVEYRSKINDFTKLIENHEFASNVFAFMQAQTMPNVWFQNFSLDAKGSSVQLTGEANDLDALSRQVASLEKNKYIKNLGTVSSLLGESARVQFNLSLALQKNIFSYIADNNSLTETTTPSFGVDVLVGEEPSDGTANLKEEPEEDTGTPVTLSNENFITAFHLKLDPEVIGTINQDNFTITLEVPYGTNVKNLISSIVLSPGATVVPDSGVSQDFTNPVEYIVIAQDETVQKYGVTVVVLPAPESNQPEESNNNLLTVIITVIIVLVISGVGAFIFWKKFKQPKDSVKPF